MEFILKWGVEKPSTWLVKDKTTPRTAGQEGKMLEDAA